MILEKKIMLFYILLLHGVDDVTAFTSRRHTHTRTAGIDIAGIDNKIPARCFSSTYMTNTEMKLSSSTSTSLGSSSLKEPDAHESDFGRRDYWNKFYTEEGDFRWYSDWNDIQPFFEELVPLEMMMEGDDVQKGSQSQPQQKPRVLLPGIGNDASMVDMYDYGYTYLTAFDYAEEGVECAKKFFGDRLLQTTKKGDDDEREENRHGRNVAIEEGVDLMVADARDLPFEDGSFDAVLEKGTLDAIFLSGANDKELAAQHLDMAVRELARVVRKGGIVMSITAACADDVRASFNRCGGGGITDTSSSSPSWKVLRDGGFYTTDDGYTSNNVDATIFAWERI